MSDSILVALASMVLSGGGVGAAVSLWSAKKKVPVERDSIAVGGAETAVLALERSLMAETRRADRAEAEVVRLQGVVSDRDQRIHALEGRLDIVQQSLDAVRDELHQLAAQAREPVKEIQKQAERLDQITDQPSGE